MSCQSKSSNHTNPVNHRQFTFLEIGLWLHLKARLILEEQNGVGTAITRRGTAGETLTVTVSSEDEGSFVVSRRGGDGSLLVGDAIVLTGYSDTPTQDLTTILPTSQEYVITVIGKDNSHYTLEMELQHK